MNIRKVLKSFRRTKRPFDSGKSGSHIDDPFKSRIKGYNRRHAAAYNSMDLYIEVDRVKNDLFPPRTVPASTPGYVRYETDYFEVIHPNKKLKDTLERYLLSRHPDIYGHSHDLAGFLEIISGSLLIDGRVFHRIDWQEVGVEGRKYVLPSNFRYLRTSTVRPKRRFGQIVGFKQRYSIIAKMLQTLYALKDSEFNATDVLYLKYPFDKYSPVQRSLKYLKAVHKFWNYGLEQSQANAEPNNYSLEVEKARYGNYAIEKRAYDITRAKIRGEFNYLIDSAKLTSFYDIYSVIKYKKFLNDFRYYFIKQFNKQVLEVAAKKNGWKTTPKLELKEGLLLDNPKLDEYLRQYSSREIDFDTVVELAIKQT